VNPQMSEPANFLVKNLNVPASNARTTFTHNSADVRDYFTLHQLVFKGASKPVRRLTHLLDKSTYVLIASLWEAYCEDVVTECLGYIIDHAPTYQALPNLIIESIQTRIRQGHGSVWDLAGDGWRDYVRGRNQGFAKQRNRAFAGPKSAAVEELFVNTIGLRDLCDKWRALGPLSICEELDAHIERRNMIIHEFVPGRAVNKLGVKNFCKTVALLVAYTDRLADEFLVGMTGESRWTSQVDH
jgi:hypothetical protein